MATEKAGAAIIGWTAIANNKSAMLAFHERAMAEASATRDSPSANARGDAKDSAK
jgi:hypothetical protein